MSYAWECKKAFKLKTKKKNKQINIPGTSVRHGVLLPLF